MNIIDNLVNQSKNKTKLITSFIRFKDKEKLQNYYYSPIDKLHIYDKIYCLSKSTLEIQYYGIIVAINLKKISLLSKNYTIHLDKEEYYYFKKLTKYNIFYDLLDS